MNRKATKRQLRSLAPAELERIAGGDMVYSYGDGAFIDMSKNQFYDWCTAHGGTVLESSSGSGSCMVDGLSTGWFIPTTK